VSLLAHAPDAEPVAIEVYARMDSRPASRTMAPALQRFGIHAIDEIASIPAVAEPIPQMAEALAGLAALPVESLPAIPPLAIVATVPGVTVLQPRIDSLLRRPLNLAGAVQGPRPIPVETMPSVEHAVAVPMATRVP